MSFPAGWYDDPQDPTQQRYWDGGFWTDYRRPREGPPPYQGQFGQAPQQGHGPGLGQPGMGREGYGPQQGHLQQGFGYAPRVPSTPDGQPLAGWWKRVLARFIDGFVLFFLTMPFAGYFYWQAMKILFNEMEDEFDRAANGASTPPVFATELPSEVYKWLIPVAVISLIVSFLYEYFFLTRKGATLGKMAVGISVRLRDLPGPPPGSAVAKRFGTNYAFQLLGWIPVVGTLFSFLGLINYLWPLWDDKKQALHDKVAQTNVVVGPQPRA